MSLGEPLFDADIDLPFECEGSPAISTDEVTRAKLIVRTYAQKKDNYNPLVQGVRDARFTNAVLLNEQQSQQQGPVLWFNRNYAEIPSTRIEPVFISFSYPGKSAVVLSKLTGLPIGWAPYGLAAPLTRQILAKATYSYAALASPSQNPSTLFTAPALSELTYKGSRVDYTGSVYVAVGQVSVPQPALVVFTGTPPTLVTTPQPPIIEQRYQFDGVVGGFFSGGNWIYSVNIRRWRGPIWEMEVIQVDNLILP
jgi:hypothetical protein